MVNIKISDNKYVDWCDNFWYGTTKNDIKKFSKEEALEIVNQLCNHYVYKVILTDDNGEVLNFVKGKEVSFTPDFNEPKYTLCDDSYCSCENALDDMEW
jgi:hypothetical protein